MIRVADGLIARAHLALRRERPSLMVFAFRCLFRDEREIGRNMVDPRQRTTLAQLRRFIEYFRAHDYCFVGPDSVVAGLDSGRNYAMITFDDGYFNNHMALPLLRANDVPGVFFISTDHVQEGKCFWWDVLHRELSAEKASARVIAGERAALEAEPPEAIEAVLRARYGADAFRPRGEIDRPFTPGELRDFAGEPWVYIGNHTANHAILTNLPTAEVQSLVLRAQAALREMAGVNPIAIAYPHGRWDERIIRARGEAGMKMGLTN